MLRPVFNLLVFLTKLGLQFFVIVWFWWTICVIVGIVSYRYFGYDILDFVKDFGIDRYECYFGNLGLATAGLIFWLIMAGHVGNMTKKGGTISGELPKVIATLIVAAVIGYVCFLVFVPAGAGIR